MKKILLVDDEKGVVAMMKSYFEMSGYQVLTACNGAEALKQAVYQPDIILLDINMPGMDGLTVCEKIRDYICCPLKRICPCRAMKAYSSQALMKDSYEPMLLICLKRISKR